MKLYVCTRNVIARQSESKRESEIDKDKDSAHIITVIKVSNKFINAVFLMITNYKEEAKAEAMQRQRCT